MTTKLHNMKDFKNSKNKGKPKNKSRWLPSFKGTPPPIPPFVKTAALQGGDPDDGEQRVRARAKVEWMNIHSQKYTEVTLKAEASKAVLDDLEGKKNVLEKLIADEEKYIMQEKPRKSA